MAAQLNYNYSTSKAVPGAKVDLADDVVATRRNEEADGVLKFGTAVAFGTTAGKTIKNVASATTAAQIEGVALAIPNTEQDTNGKVIVKANTSVGVMTKGHIWGRLADSEAPTYGATAYVSKAEGTEGYFTATAEGGLDIGAKFGNSYDLNDGIAIIIL